ncbi:MAG: hypothetical protein ACR2I1_07090 [Propionibacteriaceae bacterium]
MTFNTTQTTSDLKAASVVSRVRNTFADINYANQRLFEIQTGSDSRF